MVRAAKRYRSRWGAAGAFLLGAAGACTTTAVASAGLEPFTTEPALPPGKALAPTPARGPYHIAVDRNVFIRMRDGIRLATDLYFPVDPATGAPPTHPLPTVLTRTPYGKAGEPEDGFDVVVNVLVTNGYVVAIQDFRARWASEGEFETEEVKQHKDGYDTIQWLAAQKWSNGRVGMTGCSSGGESQLAAASVQPPALKAMIPQAAGGLTSRLEGYEDGVLPWSAYVGLGVTEGYMHTPRLSADLPHDVYNAAAAHFKITNAQPQFDYLRALWHLPEVDALRDQGLVDSYFSTFFPPPQGAAPKELDKTHRDATYRADAPALFVESWYDTLTDEALRTYNWLREKSLSSESRANQFLIIGPSTHCVDVVATADLKVGDRSLGPAPQMNYWKRFLTWYDAWLKEDAHAKSEIATWPKVTYFALGVNEWRTAPSWPPPGVTLEHYFLQSDSAANSLFGDGRLTASMVHSSHDRDSFTYDPGNPVQSLGGHNCCIGTDRLAIGAVDQSSVEARQDVLVYSTEALPQALDVSGPVTVKLFISASAEDTDFTAKLVDVSPDGQAFNVLEGIQRARYRDGPDKEVWMQPGKIYSLTVHLGSTSNVFLPGHRLRLEISSSNFPTYDRNLGLRGDNFRQDHYVKSLNSVIHSSEYPSEIALSVLKHPTAN